MRGYYRNGTSTALAVRYNLRPPHGGAPESRTRRKTEERLETVTKEKLIDDLKVVAHDVEELLKATATQTGEKIAAARARAEESLRGAQRHLFEAGDEAAARTRAAADAADDYVRDNPWQAVGVAAGVAFIIGYLIGRR
jgi:ElaB/YqjD/DUF883 family membrane-anchored ribosome-binding protein